MSAIVVAGVAVAVALYYAVEDLNAGTNADHPGENAGSAGNVIVRTISGAVTDLIESPVAIIGDAVDNLWYDIIGQPRIGQRLPNGQTQNSLFNGGPTGNANQPDPDVQPGLPVE